MNLRSLSRLVFCSCFAFFLAGFRPAAADNSHVRIIRISYVQGDVRFTRQAHGDPLSDQKAVWENAEMNLPVRQGYVLATDSGRAEVEFENGAMAFLNANTVVEFYDLSLQDGARITRLILRQGSASFYVNPAGEDYFSVTGGDFTVQANGKGSFRLNNFDDGSNVQMISGRAVVLQKKEEIQLAKGQSLTMKVGETSAQVGTAVASDEFDHWVSSRIDTVSAANRASLQYSSAPAYAPGFASLYTYGSWFTCGSYGYGWQPFGVGLGWSPFSSGQWLWDPGFGWTFVSFQPWGWAPYHYGGWLFDASCGGWFYSPPVYFNYGPYGYGYGYGNGGRPRRPPRPIVHPPAPLYRASTAVFVRQNGKLGIVPMSPLDKAGKTPLNLEHGVYSLEPGKTFSRTAFSTMGSGKWDTVKSPSRDTFHASLGSTRPPERTVTSLVEGSHGTRAVLMGHNSALIFNPIEHRYVSGAPSALASRGAQLPPGETMHPGALNGNRLPPDARSSWARTNGERGFPGGSSRSPSAPPRAMTPPPAPRSSFGSGGFGRSGGGSFSGGGGGGGFSRGSSAPAVSAPHVSAPSSGGGGGRPH